MRILQVGPIPPEIGGRTVGGVATHVWDLSRHLVKRGHDVAILADNFPNPPEIPVIKEGVRIYGFSKTFILKHLPLALLSPLAIYKLKKHFGDLMGIIPIVAFFSYYKYILKHFNPDIIHIHHIEYRFPFAYFASKSHTTLITSVHGFHSIKFTPTDQSQRNYRLIVRNLNLARYLILNSKSVEKELHEYFGEYNGKYWLGINAIDMEKYYPVDKNYAREKVGLPLEVPIVLFASRLQKRKGVYTFLKAISLCKRKNLDLIAVIIGNGEEREGVQNFIAKNELEDVVRLERTKPDLLYYYNAADLFVLPSFHEDFGLMYLEAMACGTPVIGTIGVSKEIIPSEDYGFRVPVNDSKALAEAIEKGLRKKWNKEKIINHACCFSWDKRIVEYEKIYEKIMGGYYETSS